MKVAGELSVRHTETNGSTMNKIQADSIAPIFNRLTLAHNGKRICDVLDNCPNTTLTISQDWTLAISDNMSLNTHIDPLDEDYIVMVKDQNDVDILWFHTYWYRDSYKDGRIVLSKNEDEYKLDFDDILLDDMLTRIK